MSFDKPVRYSVGRYLTQPILWFGCAMLAMLWFGTGFQIRSEYRAAGEAGQQRLENYGRVFEEHVLRTVKDLDKALHIARAEYLDFRKTMTQQEAIGQKLPNPKLLSDLSFQMAT
ncbi:MAG TPA: hypothetical protein VMX97_00220 [Hyphomicrobiaceae bacterium]|nr:hypothetical protein [Hyphomicrobiaceae bacterium]